MEHRKRMDRKVKRQTAGGAAGVMLACMLCLAGMPMRAEAADRGLYLISSEGSASLHSAGGRSLKRFSNMKLPNGSLFEAGETGSIRIRAGADGVLFMEKNGRMELRTSKNTPEVLLKQGELFFALEEGDTALSIRTPISAVTVEHAKGSIRVVDACHTLISLEEGEVRCSVTDPVSEQAETASLAGGKTAECVVYTEKEADKQCEILIRKSGEEDGNRGSSNIEEIAAEAEALRDPVWVKDTVLADISSEEVSQEESLPEEDILEEEEAGREPSHGQNSGGHSSQNNVTPVIPYVPQEDDIAEPSQTVGDSGSPSGSGGSSSSSGSGSGGSSSSGSNPGSGSSSSPSSPVTPGKEPEIPEEDQGLIGNIGVNKGTIHANMGGKVVIKNAGANEGEIHIKDKGTILTMENTWTNRKDAVIAASDEGEIRIQNSGKRLDNYGRVTVTEKGIIDGTIVNLGGSLFGAAYNAAVRGGICAKGGEIYINSDTVITAENPLKTLDVSSVQDTVNVWYGDDTIDDLDSAVHWEIAPGDEFAAFYMTKKEADGQVSLCGLEKEFEPAVTNYFKTPDVNRAGRRDGYEADTITLSGDIENELYNISVTGGTEEAPHTLNLNGKKLTLENQIQNDGLTFCNNAFWNIEGKNGTLAFEYDDMKIRQESNSTLQVTGTRIENAEIDSYNSRLKIMETTITRGICNYDTDTEIIDSVIYGRIYNSVSYPDRAKTMKISGSRLKAEAGKEARITSTGERAELEITKSEIDIYTPADSRAGIIDATNGGKIKITDCSKVSARRVELGFTEGDDAQAVIQNCKNVVLTEGINAKYSSTLEISKSTVMPGNGSIGGIYISADRSSKITLEDSAVLSGAIGIIGDAALSVSGGEITWKPDDGSDAALNYEGAVITYFCEDRDPNYIMQQLSLNNVTITNERDGAALRFVYSGGTAPTLDWYSIIRSNRVRTKNGSPIETGEENGPFIIPDGYSVETRADGYRYLVLGSSRAVRQALPARLPDISANDPAEKEAGDISANDPVEEEASDMPSSGPAKEEAADMPSGGPAEEETADKKPDETAEKESDKKSDAQGEKPDKTSSAVELSEEKKTDINDIKEDADA